MSAFCPQCGAQSASTDLFCTSCGTSLDGGLSSQPRTAAQERSPRRGRGIPLPRSRAGRLALIATVVLATAAATLLPLALLSTPPSSEAEGAAEEAPVAEPQTQTLRAKIGETLTLATGAVSLSVNPESLLDPAPAGEFDEPESGTRYVAVELTVKNTGADPYEAGVDPTLLTDDGQEADEAIVTSGECSGGLQDAIPAGATRRLCVSYAIPESAEAAELQLTLDAPALGEGGAIGIWSLAGNGTSSPSPVALTPYEAPSYSASLPQGWQIVQDYSAQGGGRHVTKAASPDEDMSVLIDTTARTSGDPADSAATLEAAAREDGSYARRAFHPIMLGATPGFEWAYEQGGRHKVDVLFFEGADGFAVLAEGAPAHAKRLGAIARAVAGSVRGS